MELRPNSRPSKVSIIIYFSGFVCMFILVLKNFQNCFVFIAANFKMPERKQNNTPWDGPKYHHYSTHYARMQSYNTWPADSKQKAENLSKAGFSIQVKYFVIKSLFIVEK